MILDGLRRRIGLLPAYLEQGDMLSVDQEKRARAYRWRDPYGDEWYFNEARGWVTHRVPEDVPARCDGLRALWLTRSTEAGTARTLFGSLTRMPR